MISGALGPTGGNWPKAETGSLMALGGLARPHGLAGHFVGCVVEDVTLGVG